jgi:hypothetical protein
MQELLPAPPVPPEPHVVNAVKEALKGSVETSPDGRSKITLTLPNAESLDAFAVALSRLMALSNGTGANTDQATARAN